MKAITTKCGCIFQHGGWITATCEHGREFAAAKGEGDFWKLVEVTEMPKIVCLCGSTRFYEAFQKANYEETMKGNIVLSVGFYPHSSTQAHGQEIGITPEQKEDLDRLHFRKIDMADEVLILNVEGYIGESTARELNYARNLGKRVRFLV
jgi:hypothetical protein